MRPGMTFVEFLSTVEDGALTSDLTEQLRTVVRAMNDQARAHGGKPKGKLTVSLALRLDDGIVEVVPAVKAEPPKAPRRRTILYPQADGSLTPNNTKQLDMEFEKGPARDASVAVTAPVVVANEPEAPRAVGLVR